MNPQNKIKLFFVIVFLVGVLLFGFLVFPIYNNIKEGVLELIIEKQKLMSLKERISNVEDFKNNYDEIKEQLEKAEGLFINSQAPVELISFLQQMSQQYQLLIEIIPSETFALAQEPWPYINFEINTQSSFPNLLRFLEKVESSPYLIEVKSFHIKRLDERELASLEGFSLGDVEGNLLLKVYAY